VVANDRRVPLKLGLNENTGYVEPINVNLLSKPYLYYGFVPKKLARNDDVQGVMVTSHAHITTVTAASGSDGQNLD